MSSSAPSSHFTHPFQHKKKKNTENAWKAAVKGTVNRWIDAEAYRLASSQAYTLLLALVPLLLVLASVGHLILGDSALLRNQALKLIDATDSRTIQTAILEVLENAQKTGGGGGVMAVVIGSVGALFTAGGVFVELDTGFNRIFGVDKQTASVRDAVSSFLRERVVGSLLVLVMVVVLMSTVIASTILSAVSSRFPSSALFLEGLISLAASVGLLTGALTLCYRYIPDCPVPWRSAAWGGAVASLIFHVLRWAFSLLIVHATNYSAYGVVGAVLTVLFWFYLISCALMVGASVTATHMDAAPPLIPRPALPSELPADAQAQPAPDHTRLTPPATTGK